MWQYFKGEIKKPHMEMYHQCVTIKTIIKIAPILMHKSMFMMTQRNASSGEIVNEICAFLSIRSQLVNIVIMMMMMIIVMMIRLVMMVSTLRRLNQLWMNLCKLLTILSNY